MEEKDKIETPNGENPPTGAIHPNGATPPNGANPPTGAIPKGTPNVPKWVNDMRSRIDGIPYGQIQVTIHRVANKTVKIETPGYETIKPESNQDAVRTILYLIGNYQDLASTGSLSLVISFKKGNIELLGVQTNKVQNYEP